MAYVISEECVSCGACVGECPNNAISEGPTMYVIDAEACVDCAACAEVCPSNAISPAE
ncbi:MAG: 4Fe-4S binding protein [bacterium]|jgi:ferredoxin